METVTDFILGASKITADGDCSHEIKRQLLTPWKKSYGQPRQHIRRRRWHPTPVLLLGKSHGRKSLVGYRPRGHKEPDTTERLHSLHLFID